LTLLKNEAMAMKTSTSFLKARVFSRSRTGSGSSESSVNCFSVGSISEGPMAANSEPLLSRVLNAASTIAS